MQTKTDGLSNSAQPKSELPKSTKEVAKSHHGVHIAKVPETWPETTKTKLPPGFLHPDLDEMG